MTKSTRHKKARKVELKKLKLKTGKKLKKPQNETKTDFKSRKIIMKEQLSIKPQSSLVTKKNLNVKELLSRLSHHSVYVQQDGLNGLKELVLSNTKYDLAPYLSILFTGLNPCILNTDHLIRSTAVKVIEVLVMKIGSMIRPYFGLLVSHLSCAMVHLNTGVQSDSLQLMDVLLSHAKSLIARNANTILKNFFLLISRKIHQQKNSVTSVTTYALISNPSSTLASIKWRIKLLRSISRYLEAILGERVKMESEIPTTSWQTIMVGCFPSLLNESSNRSSVSRTKLLTDEEEAKTFSEGLIPLLFETWAEVSSNLTLEKGAAGTPLDPISIQLLRYISEIILRLWEVTECVTQRPPVECEWFMQILGKYVEAGLLHGFPYCALEGPDDPKTKVKVDLLTECQNLNISLASLSFLYLKPTQQMRKKVALYYIDVFNNASKSCERKLDHVVLTANSFLKEGSGVEVGTCLQLLKASLKSFKELPPKDRNVLLKVPLQATEYTCQHLWKSAELLDWVEAVVESAIEDMREEAIMEVMLQFKLRRTPGFAAVMARKKSMLKEKLSLEAEENESSRMTVII